MNPADYISDRFEGVEFIEMNSLQITAVLFFELGQRLEVLPADSLLCDLRISEGHVIVAMAQQLHDSREAHAAAQE